MGKCLAPHAMLYQTAWMVGMDYGEAFRFSFNAPRQKAWAHLLLPLLWEIYTLDYDGLEVSGTGTQSLEKDHQSIRSLKEKLLALLTTIVWSCNHTYHGLNTSSLETCFLHLFANCPPIPNKAHFQIHLFGAEFAHAEDRLKALILEKKATKLQQILEKQILKRSTGDWEVARAVCIISLSGLKFSDEPHYLLQVLLKAPASV